MKKEAARYPREDPATLAIIQEASRTKPRIPDEIILFAIDTSESMRWPAASTISDKYDDEIWLGQEEEAITSRRLSYEAGHIRPKKAVESMPAQELMGSYRLVTDYRRVID